MANIPKLNTTKTITPHAAVKIWNYRDRVGPDGLTFGVDEIDQIIVSTVSLISISTSKTKSQPNGSFELVLAPTKNWVKTLTPGSWLVIMISNNPITEDDFNKAHPDKVKFFGRIDSVRVSTTVDGNGTSTRVYQVSGSDWAQIFNSILYVDPVNRDLNETPISVANRLVYDNYVGDLIKGTNLPSSTFNVTKLIELWGTTSQTFQQINNAITGTNITAKPEIAFSIPQAVSSYFNFKTEKGGKKSNKLTSLINIRAGKLKGKDDYDSEQVEAVGIIKPDCLFGAHTFWQVLMDNCNHVLNEMIADIRWEKQGDSNAEAKLTLYKRIKPFAIREASQIKAYPTNQRKQSSAANDDIVRSLISKFSNIRQVNIPLENVISIDAGTNWRDKYNYAEIQIDKSLVDEAFNAQVKLNNAIYDSNVFGREGFKPLILQSKYIPSQKDGSYNPLAIYNWKFLLKEWYFDTHNMLNGTLTFTGINEYIQVGDNVLVKAEVLGIDDNLNTSTINFNNAYMLAHVENISHSFVMNEETKTRLFITTVQFVRGIITDQNGTLFSGRNISTTIDQDAKALRFDQEDNTTSVVSDPVLTYAGQVGPKESSGTGGGNGNN